MTAPDDMSEADIADLIEIYFEIEKPEERDVVFDRISAVHAPIVDEFLRVMMQEDEDEYMRSAAAGELARRGDAIAVQLIESDLEEPDDIYFFEHAVEVLGALRGAPFYDTLQAIWHDSERDADQRRAAMVGMEAVDAPRALADMRRFIDAMVDVETLADDQLEVAMAAFARHAYTEATTPLRALHDRILASPLDDEEKQELAGLVAEGLALLRA